MGWSFTKGAKRADIVRERIESWSTEACTCRTLRHCVRGGVLWTVRELEDERSGKIERYIGCDLLERDPGFGWGYKPLSEAAEPYYYSCPPAYLALVPVACERWREKVREHARKKEVRERARKKMVRELVRKGGVCPS